MNGPDSHGAARAAESTLPESRSTTAPNLDRKTRWEHRFPWEGRRLLEQLQSLTRAGPPRQVLAYVSESPELREVLRQTILATCGASCSARVRSAYKTAYFWVTEEVRPLWRRAHADRLTLTYPRLADENPGRFLQEAYPLAAVLEREGVRADFQPGDTGEPAYHAVLWRGDKELWRGSCFVPLTHRESPDGRTVLAPTGWLRVQGEGGLWHDAPLPSTLR